MIRVLEGIKPQSRVARHTVQQEGQLAPKADTHPYLPELTRTHNDDDGGADGNAKEALLRQSAVDHAPEDPSSIPVWAGGAGPAPLCRISKLPSLHLSIHAAIHTIISS
eukprot:1158564-Pelagomonas_calceolata.AAC.4